MKTDKDMTTIAVTNVWSVLPVHLPYSRVQCSICSQWPVFIGNTCVPLTWNSHKTNLAFLYVIEGALKEYDVLSYVEPSLTLAGNKCPCIVHTICSPPGQQGAGSHLLTTTSVYRLSVLSIDLHAYKQIYLSACWLWGDSEHNVHS